jgi:hypothetical protein
MVTRAQDIFRILVIASVILILVPILGVGFFRMSVDTDGIMAPCPFMNGSASMCGMNALDHIANWQLLLVTLPLQKNIALVLLFVSLLIFLFYVYARKSIRENNFLGSRYLYAHEQKEEESNFLIELFSRGIIHPRLHIA